MDSVREKLEKKVSGIEEINEDELERDMSYQQNSDMAFSLEQARKRISTLQVFIKDMMTEGVDYGLIGNTDKRCLFKSGAEKLCDIFGFSKRIEVLSRMEDFEKGIFHYEIKAILVNKRSGVIEAEGVGSCNNMEKKYKNQDPFNMANTILKMAKKRAFVDAVLSATRSSDIFTQDIEDDLVKQEPVNSQNNSNQNVRTLDVADKVDMASTKQISYIFTLFSQNRIPIENARILMTNRYGVNESNQLSKSQAKDFIEYLKEYKSQQAG